MARKERLTRYNHRSILTKFHANVLWRGTTIKFQLNNDNKKFEWQSVILAFKKNNKSNDHLYFCKYRERRKINFCSFCHLKFVIINL